MIGFVKSVKMPMLMPGSGMLGQLMMAPSKEDLTNLLPLLPPLPPTLEESETSEKLGSGKLLKHKTKE